MSSSEVDPLHGVSSISFFGSFAASGKRHGQTALSASMPTGSSGSEVGTTVVAAVGSGAPNKCSLCCAIFEVLFFSLLLVGEDGRRARPLRYCSAPAACRAVRTSQCGRAFGQTCGAACCAVTMHRRVAVCCTGRATAAAAASRCEFGPTPPQNPFGRARADLHLQPVVTCATCEPGQIRRRRHWP
eukprot:scaffold20310_cov125-Isochrysis_galbana.AAC.19